MITIRISPLLGFLLLLLVVGGCGDLPDRHPKQLGVEDKNPEVAPTAPKPPEKTPDRFKIESQGFFNAGHQNNSREILIITDEKTGKQYLGITGVGITEMVREGKHQGEE